MLVQDEDFRAQVTAVSKGKQWTTEKRERAISPGKTMLPTAAETGRNSGGGEMTVVFNPLFRVELNKTDKEQSSRNHVYER